MIVINRSSENVTYELPELRVRREFEPGTSKDIPAEELEMLSQQTGGLILLKDNLLVEDKEWVKAHMPDAPIEYFWKPDDIMNCLKYDSLELFRETLEYAPYGVITIMEQLAWRLPLTDLNKIQALKDICGFDTLAAIDAMKTTKPQTENKTSKRLRQEV